MLLLLAVCSIAWPAPKSRLVKQHRAAKVDVPTDAELRKFALPALALWVAGPVLTLIDTSAVGISAGAAQSAVEIAALGPATSVCDGTGYFFAFLNVAATNLLASAASDEERATVARRGLQLALYCGVTSAVLLRILAKPVLTIFVGAESAAVLEKSAAYVETRALGLPLLLLSNVLTACLLGVKDSMAPLRAQVASATTNVVGDYAAVFALGRGTRGAAEATVLAQLVSALVLWRAASKPIKFKAAKIKTTGSYAAFAGPVLILVASKIASFGCMTHAAARLGELALAAHQLSFTLYLVASLVLEALAAQTAQAFLPPLKNNPVARLDVARRLGNLATWSALIVGALSFGFASLAAPLFSGDVRVASYLATLGPALTASVLLHGAVAHGEGILIAAGDLAFVGGAYLASALVFPGLLLWLVYNGIFVTEGARIWLAFTAFQLARAVVFQLRAAKLLGGSLLFSSKKDA